MTLAWVLVLALLLRLLCWTFALLVFMLELLVFMLELLVFMLELVLALWVCAAGAEWNAVRAPVDTNVPNGPNTPDPNGVIAMPGPTEPRHEASEPFLDARRDARPRSLGLPVMDRSEPRAARLRASLIAPSSAASCVRRSTNTSLAGTPRKDCSGISAASTEITVPSLTARYLGGGEGVTNKTKSKEKKRKL